jgi:hypothetical protein
VKPHAAKPTFKQRRLGFVAGMLLGRGRKPKATPRQLHQSDFKTSTRRMGIRFSERLRDALRPGWLRLK